ncbi:MAG: hypothetical protein EA383_06290 [Spirochaetaceae bacterium]|nr:MAG: hypothetical protein EA383_06290 [Spirochaetaceae bacterium]
MTKSGRSRALFLPVHNLFRAALTLLSVVLVLNACQWTLNDTVVDTELQIIVPRSPGISSGDGRISASSVTPDTELFVHIIEADRFEQLYLESNELPPLPGNGSPPPEGARRLRPEQLGLSDSAVLRAFQDGTTLRGSRFFWLFGQGVAIEDGTQAITFRNLKPETDYIVYAIQGQRVFGEDENSNLTSYFDYTDDIYWGAAAINLEPRSIVREEINLSSVLQFEPAILPTSYFEPLDSLGISLDRFPWEPPEVRAGTLIAGNYEITVTSTVSVEGFEDFSLDMHEIAQVIPFADGYSLIYFFGPGFMATNFSGIELIDSPASLEPSFSSYEIPSSFTRTNDPGSLWQLYIEDSSQGIYLLIFPELYDPEGDNYVIDLDMGFVGGVPPSQGGRLVINFEGEADVGLFDGPPPVRTTVGINWTIDFGDPIPDTENGSGENGDFIPPEQ